MRGSEIILASNPRGMFMEGYIKTGETPYPGTHMQVDPTVALRGGRHTYNIYNPGADGEHPLGPIWILNYDYLAGRLPTAAYAAGERCFLYCPYAGEEFNLLVKNIAGTADDHALGEKLMIDTGTGMLIATTGTPESEPYVLLEAITDPTADTLAWVQYTGY